MKRWLLILLGVMSIAAGSIELLVRLKARVIHRRQEGELLHALETGALQPMLRARALGQRLASAHGEDAHTQLLLALVDALLARLFGLGTDAEAEEQVRHAALSEKTDADSLFGTVEALLALGRGQVDAARAHALRATQLAPGQPFPLIALAMCHAHAGALAAASKVLEAVMVREPQLVTARVAWAEVRIDLGDFETAAAELESVLRRVPGHTRAALLLSEARTAIATGRLGPRSSSQGRPELLAHARAALDADCQREGRYSPSIGAACALDEAGRARLDGRRDAASERALAAAKMIPFEPRMLARAAQLLAQLGQVDVAASLVERAATGNSSLQALSWARAAVTLGRGGVAAVPATVSISGPESTVIAARAAFAAGGTAGLSSFLATIGPAAVSADPDLSRLARLVDFSDTARMPDSARPPNPSGPQTPADPVDAYVIGMRARLGRNNRSAVEWLSRALDGHGDACRAAGEYLEALRSLGQKRPPESAFARLRATNRSCISIAGPDPAPPVYEHRRDRK